MSKINAFLTELEAQELIQQNKYKEALPLLVQSLTKGEYISRETILQNIALCHIKTDNYLDAQPYLEQLINLNKNNTTARYNLAYSHYKLRQYQQACVLFEYLEQAEGITPDIAYHYSICLIMEGNHKKAVSYYDYIISIFPSPDLIYNMGLELVQLNQAQSARDIFIRYLDKYNNDIDATFGLGISYIECKDYFKALECLERVISWDKKKYPSAYTMLGVAYFQIGKIKEAYKHIKTALRMDESSYESWYYMGIIYEQGKQIPESIEAFNKASDLNPDSYEVWEHLGFIHFNIEDYTRARFAFKKAYFLSKNNKFAYQIGLIYMVLENFKSAVDYFTLSMDKDIYKDSLENISICYYHLKEYDKVIELLCNLEQEQLDKAILHFILGSSYMKTGNNSESRKRLTLGHKRFPSEINILYSLGLLEASEENFNEACRFFEKALIINRSPEILYALSLAKIQLNETPEAITHLNEYQMHMEKDEDTLYKLGLLYLQLGARKNAKITFEKILDQHPGHSGAVKYLQELESPHV